VYGARCVATTWGPPGASVPDSRSRSRSRDHWARARRALDRPSSCAVVRGGRAARAAAARTGLSARTAGRTRRDAPSDQVPLSRTGCVRVRLRSRREGSRSRPSHWRFWHGSMRARWLLEVAAGKATPGGGRKLAGSRCGGRRLPPMRACVWDRTKRANSMELGLWGEVLRREFERAAGWRANVRTVD